MNLKELSKHFHERAKAKGFWDEKREIGTLLMLIVSELSEALEADRKSRHADFKAFYARRDDRANWTDFESDFQELIKDTFEDEIADTFIRLFDLVGHLGIDIDRHIKLKMMYNQTREHKHGKAY
jgi:NTP pyrophosphatase (non-canonical NTP hydrolase)